jgi:hypothetical protein
MSSESAETKVQLQPLTFTSTPKIPKDLETALSDVNLNGVYFLPWIGSEFRERCTRLLLLGESHYGDEPATQRATIKCTQAYVDGLWRHKFWTNIMQVVQGAKYSEIDAALFWSRVALYNYIQTIVSPEAGVAPTEDMWRDAEPAFYLVLQYLDPTHILVLSKRLWTRLPISSYRCQSSVVCDDFTMEIRNFDLGLGRTAVGTWLPHPSYHFHFSANKLHPLVKEFLNLGR